MKDYYKHYLNLHKNKKCRMLHFIGQLATIAFTVWILSNWYWYLIPGIPFVVYPFAWTGHYMFEKNKPAAFHDPVKAKIADWMMFRDILLGRIKIF